MESLLPYAAVFASSLVSATIVPAQSEAVLFGMLLAHGEQWALLILAASVGNVLGSVVNWVLGRFIVRFEGKRCFPVGRETMAKAEGWYRRYGRWTLLLSWVPVIGDPLTLVAGVLREPLPAFILLVAIAKTARYLAVGALSLGWV